MRNYINNCPHCDYLLDRGDIVDHFVKEGKTLKESLRIALDYGWTPKTPARFSAIIGVDDPYLDRVTHYVCPGCRKVIESPFEGTPEPPKAA